MMTWQRLRIKIKELAKQESTFARRDVSKAEALDYFTKKVTNTSLN
jgi:threonyl-tRNA synthetase